MANNNSGAGSHDVPFLQNRHSGGRYARSHGPDRLRYHGTLEGVVSVFEMLGHTAVGEFTLKKTFAWGGIYGAATSIEDIEDTFADGVAAAVTGQKEAPPKQKT